MAPYSSTLLPLRKDGAMLWGELLHSFPVLKVPLPAPEGSPAPQLVQILHHFTGQSKRAGKKRLSGPAAGRSAPLPACSPRVGLCCSQEGAQGFHLPSQHLEG